MPQAVLCPSQHAEQNELRNHTLKVKACLEGKGLLQTLTPSLCSRPNQKHTLEPLFLLWRLSFILGRTLSFRLHSCLS
jgi:hypothetical protein